MPRPLRATVVLADRPTGRPALVALAGALEASACASRVELVLARGAEAVRAAARSGGEAGNAVVVAWSFFSAEAAPVAAELAAVRAGGPPGALHVAGGVHATADPAGTLALGFDVAAVGEGEATFVTLLERVLEGRPGDAPGLCRREGGRVLASDRAPPLELDGWPAFSRRLGKALALEVTRGCAWSCRFCQTRSLHRGGFRHRSVDSARAWARFAVELGHRDLRFLTPSALSYGARGREVRLDEVEALLAAVREEAGPSRRVFFGTFPSELRPEHVTPESLSVLRRWVDNRELLLGGQSGSERMLAAMRRGHGVEEVVRAVRYAREAGFAPAVDFLVGCPGEGEEDRDATRRLMVRLAELGARVHGHVFLPLPGTAWRRAAPGEVDAATRALLDRLASRGAAYGQWRRQERLAAALSRARCSS